MPRPLANHALSLAVIVALISGCHRPAQLASTPVEQPKYEHCWWAALRTSMPPDSVAARYAGAFATLGLTKTGWSHQADTAWAEGGPTVVTRADGTASISARVVAYRRGDTTLVRPFNSVRPIGPANLGGLKIGFCQDAIRTARAGVTAPSGEERDDSLPVWRRRPTP